jgi:hypothetical protein
MCSVWLLSSGCGALLAQKPGPDLFGSHDAEVDKIVSDASESEASTPSSSSGAGDWDDWDADSEPETVTAPANGSSSVGTMDFVCLTGTISRLSPLCVC